MKHMLDGDTRYRWYETLQLKFIIALNLVFWSSLDRAKFLFFIAKVLLREFDILFSGITVSAIKSSHSIFVLRP